MNKKVVLRKWLEYTLIIVNMFCIFILAGDCESWSLFIWKTIIAMIILTFNTTILEIYAR